MFTSILGGLAVGAGGALLGHVLGDGGTQQAGTTTVTQNNAPWSGIQPYLADLYAKAQSQAGRGAYPGPYIAPQSPYSVAGINALGQGAQQPGNLVGQAQGQLGATIGGQYLNPGSNPYLSGAVQQALDQVKRNVNSQFSGENYGSSANQQWLAQNMANTALPIYAQNYQNERTNQLNALNLAPSLQSANANQLTQAGNLQDVYNQQKIQAQQQQFNAPWGTLGQYGGLLGTVQTPSSSATSTPYYTNPYANALGGALGGLQLYNAIQPTNFGSPSSYNPVGVNNAGAYDYGNGANLGFYGGT